VLHRPPALRGRLSPIVESDGPQRSNFFLAHGRSPSTTCGDSTGGGIWML